MFIGIASIITAILAPLAAVRFAQRLAAAESRRETVTRLLAKIYADAYHLYDSILFYATAAEENARLQIRLDIKAARKAIEGNLLIASMIFGSAAGSLQAILTKMSQEAFTAVIDDKAKVEDLDQALENVDAHFKELGQALRDLWSNEMTAAHSRGWAIFGRPALAAS